MGKKNLFEHIVKALDGNSDFLSKISGVEPDPFYNTEVLKVSHFIENVILEAKDFTLYPGEIRSSSSKFK